MSGRRWILDTFEALDRVASKHGVDERSVTIHQDVGGAWVTVKMTAWVDQETPVHIEAQFIGGCEPDVARMNRAAERLRTAVDNPEGLERGCFYELYPEVGPEHRETPDA